MEIKNNDYENLLFYFAYKTFITTADEIIKDYGLNRQHHRFLFFIEKVPGISIKDLFKNLEISKQGIHATLKKLRDKAFVVEKQATEDKRIKMLYQTEKSRKLVRNLKKAKNDMFKEIQEKVGNDWYAIMEEFASYREGFQSVKYLKGDRE